ncbi:hypothetical protein ACP70R_046416 [Stipagrostis hirtigluma subsp. patula]
MNVQLLIRCNRTLARLIAETRVELAKAYLAKRNTAYTRKKGLLTKEQYLEFCEHDVWLKNVFRSFAKHWGGNRYKHGFVARGRGSISAEVDSFVDKYEYPQATTSEAPHTAPAPATAPASAPAPDNWIATANEYYE